MLTIEVHEVIPLPNQRQGPLRNLLLGPPSPWGSRGQRHRGTGRKLIELGEHYPTSLGVMNNAAIRRSDSSNDDAIVERSQDSRNTELVAWFHSFALPDYLRPLLLRLGSTRLNEPPGPLVGGIFSPRETVTS